MPFLRKEFRSLLESYHIKPLTVVHSGNIFKYPREIISAYPGHPGHGSLAQIIRGQIVLDMIRDRDHTSHHIITVAVSVFFCQFRCKFFSVLIKREHEFHEQHAASDFFVRSVREKYDLHPVYKIFKSARKPGVCTHTYHMKVSIHMHDPS